MEQKITPNQLLYTIDGLKEWLLQNKSRLRGGFAQPFSIIDQDFNICYWEIESFLEHEQYFDEAINAIKNLKSINYHDAEELKAWCIQFQQLGYNMFEFAIFYLWTDGDIPEDRIRVYESIYSESKPFRDLIFLSNIYELIVSDDNVLMLTPENIGEIQTIIKKFLIS